jgi:hypothetical protein
MRGNFNFNFNFRELGRECAGASHECERRRARELRGDSDSGELAWRGVASGGLTGEGGGRGAGWG